MVNHQTLPATLPELRTMDRGPRTGVTAGVSQSALDFIERGGPQGAGGGPWILAPGTRFLVFGWVWLNHNSISF